MIPTTLQRYVLRETLRVALLAAIALSAIIFVGVGVSMVQRGVSVVQLWGLIPFLVAFSLPYAVPCALLVAAVFVFGRLSGSNEITAIRGTGINLNHVIVPLLIVAVLVCGGTFWLNHYLLPWGNARKNEMGKELVGRALTQIGSVQKVFPIGDYVIYVGRAEEKATLWQNVAVIEFADDEFPSRIMIAKQAHCAVDEENEEVKLLLLDAVLIQPKLGGDLESQAPRASFARISHTIDLSEGRRPSERPKYAQLPELLDRIEDLETAAAEIHRTFDDPAALEHPRQAREAAEKRMDAAWREVQRVDENIAKCRNELKEAEAAVQEAEDLTLETKGDVGAARQEHDDLAAKITEREPTLEAMKAELKSLIENEAEPERIKERQEEIRNEAQAIDALRLKLDAAALELEKKEAVLKETEAALNACEKKAETAREALAVAEERAQSAHARYEAEKARVGQVKDIESLLRAKTAFHWRNASALTTLIFVMIGIPLGILSRRGSVLMAFVVSFFAVLVLYYPLMMIAKLVSLDGYVTPWLAQWTPNVVVGGIGLWLLTRGIRR